MALRLKPPPRPKKRRTKLKNGVYEMVITDMRMENETSGYDVIRTARQQPYDPATALLTAYPSLGNEWKSKGAQSLLVKPVNTPELLRQLEALLITHQDQKMLGQKDSVKKAAIAETAKVERHSRPRERNRFG